MPVPDDGAAVLAPPPPPEAARPADTTRPSDRKVAPQKPKAAAPVTEHWTMPPAYLGQRVLWRPDKAELVDIAPGFVTKVGRDSIGLSVLIDGNAVMVPKDGARHVNDPRYTRENSAGSGVWWYHEEDTETLATFGDLTKALEAHHRNAQRVAELAIQQQDTIQRLVSRVEKLEAERTAGGSPAVVTGPPTPDANLGPDGKPIINDKPIPPVGSKKDKQ